MMTSRRGHDRTEKRVSLAMERTEEDKPREDVTGKG